MSAVAMRRGLVAVAAIASLLAALAALVWLLAVRGDVAVDAAVPLPNDPALVERGAYLAKLGNCAACHTAPGGPPFAGGPGITTPFGTVYASNLTPDAATGIGDWNPDHFWRALHVGRSKDGRLLYPAFPYTEYTRVTRADADAIFAYLRTLAPVARPNRPHALRFPYDTQAALAVWRALWFRPGEHRDDPRRSEAWNRGAYLVGGLAHCNACHGARNVLGATADEPLGGGLIPAQNWYAPSLTAPHEAGVGDWSIEEIVALLGTGVSPRGSVLGPMAEVVFRSTQYARPDDLRAIATFLKELPQTTTAPSPRPALPADDTVMRRGARLYETHCGGCHGDAGEGATGAYPPLAGNRAVLLASPANVVRVILLGGFQPATAGNPRPWGMPPYVHTLDEGEIAAVATYVRNAWGNAASPVSQSDVARYR
jgi:mono/diheme cytochrome c family protein